MATKRLDEALRRLSEAKRQRDNAETAAGLVLLENPELGHVWLAATKELESAITAVLVAFGGDES